MSEQPETRPVLEPGASRIQDLNVMAARSTFSTLGIHLGVHAD